MTVSEGLPITNNEYTTEPEGLSSDICGQNLLMKQAVDWLVHKFRGVYHWITGIREDGSIFKIPATARGNETYAYYQQARIKQIQEALTKKIRIEENTTNALFITLTQKYDRNSINKIKESWYNTKSALIKFKAKMRKLGMKDYAMTVEAHEAGGCHAHLVVIFDRQLKTFATKEKRRLADIELLYKIKKAWAVSLNKDLNPYKNIVKLS